MKLEQFYSAKELANFRVKALPTTEQGIKLRAKQQNWLSRKRSGRGGGVEYALNSLPPEVQTELLLLSAVEKTEENQPHLAQSKMSESAWNVLASSSLAQEARAERRLQAVCRLAALLEQKMPIMQALAQVVEFYGRESSEEPVSVGGLKRWWYRVKGAPRSDWLPLLLDRDKGAGKREMEIHEKLWTYFCDEYLRLAAPTFAMSYYNTQLVAEAHGWTMPSKSTIDRRLKAEFTPQQIALARYGKDAVREMLPTQIRTVAHLDALEIVNGDGYQHNVWVDWYGDGSKPIRPKTWFWQDVRTRRILAYCVDDSENSDSIRQATLRLVRQYGIPKKILMDNTKAASDQQVSRQRRRFGNKQNDNAIDGGLLDKLGIQVIRTLVINGKGNGRAKPIERAFRRDSLPALIDAHRKLEGFFIGWGVNEKVENYQYKKGVDKALFLDIVEQGVRKWNAKPNRETELGKGIYSADQLWERDYAQTKQRFATEEQLRMLMLVGESTAIKKGRFSLKAGGKLHGQRNIYEAPALIGTSFKNVVVRFDPDDLHGTVYVYDPNGVYLCDAQCVQATAFDTMAGARQQRRMETQQHKAAKKFVESRTKMDELEYQQLERKLGVPDADLVEPEERLPFVDFSQTLSHWADGNTVRQAVNELDEDEPLSEFEQGQRNYIEMMKKARGE